MERGDMLYRLTIREELRIGALLTGERVVAPVIARAVLGVLLAGADRSGRCWPSVRRIAECCELSRPTVQRALKALEAAGLLSRKQRAFSPSDKEKGRTTIYKLSWPLLERLSGLGEVDGRVSNGGPSTPSKGIQWRPSRVSNGGPNHLQLNQGAAPRESVPPQADEDSRPVTFTEAMRLLQSEGVTLPEVIRLGAMQ